MKTLLLILALVTTTGCMTDWVDVPVHGPGAKTGGDTNQKVSDPKPGAVGCDTPAKDRLVSNGDGTWHDKLLNLDCAFFATTGLGKRCVPFYGHPFGSEALGNPNFPEANPIGYWQSDDCQSNQVFIVVPDSMGHFAPYGFHMDLKGGTSILNAVNLVDPDPSTVTSTNVITGKATGLSGIHIGPSCNLQKAETFAEFGAMLSNGTATFPTCPYLTGLNLFAELPTK